MARHGTTERQAAREPKAAARLCLLLLVEVGAVIVLYRLGADPATRIPWRGLGDWLATTPPEDAAWAVVRLVGLAVAWWQLLSTVAYVAARASRLPSLVSGVQWACLPGVRRLVDAALAVSIVGSAVLSTAPARANTQTTNPAPVVVQVGSPTAAGSPHAYHPVAAGDAAPGQRPSTSTTTAAPPPTATTTVAPLNTTASPPPSPVMSPPPPASPGRAPQRVAAEEFHDVVPGDNLWSIAAEHIGAVTGRRTGEVAEAEVRTYWLRVMAANKGRLRSGNPNLIFPGERVVCPPVDESQP